MNRRIFSAGASWKRPPQGVAAPVPAMGGRLLGGRGAINIQQPASGAISGSKIWVECRALWPKSAWMDRPEKVALYPGSFDPVTNGHLDVAQRAMELFDRVIFGIAVHTPKKTLFDAEERVGLAREALAGAGGRVEVAVFEGLLVDFARRRGVTAIVRGLRAVADFEFEFQIALVNRNFAPEIETIFMMPKESLIYLSSSLIKEIAQLGGDVSALVPPNVDRALRKKFGAVR